MSQDYKTKLEFLDHLEQKWPPETVLQYRVLINVDKWGYSHYLWGKIVVAAWLPVGIFPYALDLVVEATPSYLVLRYDSDAGEFRVRHVGHDSQDGETLRAGKVIHLFDIADQWTLWRPDAAKESKLKAEAEITKICADEPKLVLPDPNESKESKKRKEQPEPDDLIFTTTVYDLMKEDRRANLIKELTEDGQQGLRRFHVNDAYGVSKWNVVFEFEDLDRNKRVK